MFSVCMTIPSPLIGKIGLLAEPLVLITLLGMGSELVVEANHCRVTPFLVRRTVALC